MSVFVPNADRVEPDLPLTTRLKRGAAIVAIFPLIVAVVIVSSLWQWWDGRLEAKKFAR